MAEAFTLGERRKHRLHNYGDVTLNTEGKKLRVVEGFLLKKTNKEFLVTSISCLEGHLVISVSDYKVLCTVWNSSLFS